MTTEKKSILIVDDEVDTLELLQMILEHEGFKVWKAINGKEALEYVEKVPDLILLDIRMPGGLTGLDVCHHLKENDMYKHIPIIIFSAKVSKDDIELGLEAGANEYITKPFSSKELIRVVDIHI